MKAEIFTTPTCIKCRGLKTQLESESFNLDISFIDATTGEGAILAQKRGIRSAPTIYVYNNNNVLLGIAYDIDEIENILNI